MAVTRLRKRELKYTPEVKVLASRVVAGCRKEAAPGFHARRLAPLERAVSLTGISRKTLAAWTEEIQADEEVPADGRGGDRRSVEALDGDAASLATDIVRSTIADRHAHGSAATVAMILDALREEAATASFFKNRYAVQRFMHHQGIRFRKTDKYVHLKSAPAVVKAREACIFLLLQNR